MYTVKTICGTGAVDEFLNHAEYDEPIDPEEIQRNGFIVERSFKTKAEVKAYLRGLVDADGSLKTLSLEPPEQEIFGVEPMNKYYDQL